jgi:lipopolysaccharide export system permease protein
MRILDRYVVYEFVGPLTLSVLAFIVIMLSGQLFWLVDLIIQKKVPVLVVARMLMYSLPGIVVQVLPIAVLFGAMIGLGRLARDSELHIMRASGVPFARIVLPLIVLGAIMSAGGFWLNESVVPWATHQSETIVREMIFQEAFPAVEEDVFFKAPGGRYFYVGKVNENRGTLERVMIYETERNMFPRLVSAESGRAESGKWVLENGSIHELDAEGHVQMSMSFETMEISLEKELESFSSSQKTPEEMSRKELKSNIDLFERSGIRVHGLRVDYHLKLAQPLAALVFAVIGAPLVTKSPRRGGGYFGVVAAAILSFAYYIVQALARSVAIRGTISPLLAAWLPNAVFGIPGLLMLYVVDRPQIGLAAKRRGSGGANGSGANGKNTSMMCGIVALTTLYLLAFCSPCAVAKSIPVKVRAEKVVYDGAVGLWVISGDVKIEYEDAVISGDYAEFDMGRKVVVVNGSVRVSLGEEEMTGQSAVFNVSNGEVVMDDARAKLAGEGVEGYLYMSGGQLEKKEDYLRLSHGAITTCDLERPHYRLEVEEMEVYVDDRIVLHSVAYYEGNLKLLRLPRLVVPLKEDERFELPKIGYGALEGWYVKTKYNYKLTDDAYGSLYADYFQLMGPAAGISQNLRLGEAGVLTAYLYGLWNRGADGLDTTLELSHDLKLPLDIGAKAACRQRNYINILGDEISERSCNLSLTRRVQSSNTSFTGSFRETDASAYSSMVNATFRHSSTLPYDIKLSSNVDYKKQVKNSDVTQDVLSYNVQADRTHGGFSVRGLAQAQVYVEDPSDIEVKPPPWKALRRLPEFTATANGIALGSGPLVMDVKGVFGNYTEDAIRDGIRSEVTAAKGGLDLTLRVKSKQIFTWLSVDGYARGVFDVYQGLGDRAAAQYSVGTYVKPASGTTLRLSYTETDVHGASPFRFDEVRPASKLSGNLTTSAGPARLTVATGYDFASERYDPLNATLRVDIAKGLSLDFSGRYNLQQRSPTSIVGRVVVQPSPEIQVKAGGSYDFVRGQFTRVESSGDVRFSPEWRFQWTGVYDFFKGGLVRGDIGITRDLHCREVALTYQHASRRVWLEFRLKAFPGKPLGFGLGEEGILFQQ